MGGLELVVLARHLRREGYRVTIFWRNPWQGNLTDQAKALYQMLVGQQNETPHLVAHSMGGRVVLQMLQDYPQQEVGRIVLLGTPLGGCLAAKRIMRIPGGHYVLGKALSFVGSNPVVAFPEGREIGSIAGRFNFLLGVVFCPHKPNDTLVCVEETRHPHLADHCVLRVSHTSMLFSHPVSKQVVSFLRRERFSFDSSK
jgi:pimeloyl-ACP methyl ester carboxylesterase